MRISDWSSDVCSSDLRRICRTVPDRPESGCGKYLPLKPEYECEQTACCPCALHSQSSALPAPPPGPPYAPRQRERPDGVRSEEHTSELQSLMRISYAVFCLNKKIKKITQSTHTCHTR